MNKYLHDIVIPFYKGQINKSLNFTLYDAQGEIHLMSRYQQDELNRCKVHLEHKTFSDFTHFKPEIRDQLYAIFEKVISIKKTIFFIVIGGYTQETPTDYYNLIFKLYEPITDFDGNVVAVVEKTVPEIYPNLYQRFFGNYKPDSFKRSDMIDNLSKRELEILYLTSNNESQYEIATRLNISRSTVLKNLSSGITDKFGLDKYDLQRLVKSASAMGIYSKLPKSLISEQVLIIYQQ